MNKSLPKDYEATTCFLIVLFGLLIIAIGVSI